MEEILLLGGRIFLTAFFFVFAGFFWATHLVDEKPSWMYYGWASALIAAGNLAFIVASNC